VNPVTHIGNDRSEIISPKIIHYAPVNKNVLAEQIVAVGASVAIIAKILGW
jgi:hypothetical protein